MCRTAGLLLGLLAALPSAVQAGSFGVSPIRIDLGPAARTGAITVTNDNEEELRVQIRLAEWTQDAAGKDVYRDSEDLVFFPRLMTIGRGEQKLVRVGLRQAAGPQEKAYRLFVEELPPPPQPGAADRARVAIAVRFGVPIFVLPPKEEARGSIERLELADGKLRVGVRNTGNVHFTIRSIAASGAGGFSKEMAGWYLLPGAAREHELHIPSKDCAALKQLLVAAQTDRIELKDSLAVDPSRCGD